MATPFLILLLIIFFVAILLFAIVSIDLYLSLKMFYNRLYFGKWQSIEIWINAVKKVNKTWLKKTPTVKLTDNDKYVVFDILKGRYKSNTIQSWQEAGCLLGAIHTEESKKAIDLFIKQKIDLATSTWLQKPEYVDGAILAYAISKTNIAPQKLKPAFDDIITLIESFKGNDGTVFYRNYTSTIRFVDTIGFICPFLTFYAQTFNKPEYIDLAFKQIEAYVDKAFLKQPFIPAHAYDIKKNLPLGIYGWGRGLGWFILGVVDMYIELDALHPKKETLKNMIIKTAESTLPLQKPDGGFNAMMGVDMSRHDSSITSLAGWLFYNAFIITKEVRLLNASKACLNCLMKVTRRSGAIDFCQGDTKGIGIYATTFDVMPFVQGLTIRLAESLKKNNND